MSSPVVKMPWQRLVAPHQDVGRVGGDLIRQRLPAGGRLGALDEQPRGEDALVVESVEMGGLDTGQLIDRWHVAMMPRRAGAPRRIRAQPAPTL
jgi:hypothetical protein